jgi:hypothetical protein
MKDGRMSDELANWAATRADELIARAEAEAIAELKRALLSAASSRTRLGPAIRPTPEPAPPASPGPAARETLLWAYFVSSASDPLPDGLSGLHGDVERVEHNGLAAAVSRVPASEFGEAVLHESLNDLAWLERVARTHESILEDAGAENTVVPLRLCTIFNDTAAVRGMLDANGPALASALEYLAGRQEWAVKLLVDPGALEAAVDLTEVAEERDSGTAYLLGRRAERERRAAAEQLARELAEGVHAQLQDWAIDAVVNPPQRRELSGHVGDMLLNGAYLVERSRAGELQALAAELQERHRSLGARIEVSGPLPPFNFVGGARGAPA